MPTAASLSGVVTDDGYPTKVLLVSWTRVSGPAGVTFTNAASASTSVIFSMAGTYVLRLSASDSALSASDELTVVAENPPPPPPPINNAPTANAGGPYSGEVSAPVTFNGRNSSDPDNNLLTYTWDFGDGTQGAGSAPVHAYDHDGTFTVTLTVNDGRGGSHVAVTSALISAAADRPRRRCR